MGQTVVWPSLPPDPVAVLAGSGPRTSDETFATHTNTSDQAARDPFGPKIEAVSTDSPTFGEPVRTTALPEFGPPPYRAADAVRDVIVYDGLPPYGSRIGRVSLWGMYDERRTFLIRNEARDIHNRVWYNVWLPEKPNESSGWIRASDVQVRELTAAVRIDLSDHLLTLYEQGTAAATFPVAVGKRGTPTPSGRFFITMHVPQGNPAGAYGPLAMGLSAFSEVLTDWPGGGQTAVHGTNRPELIGTDASHGCVRMTNADVVALGRLTPAGTPVLIQP